MSDQERNSWATLIVNFAVGCWCFSHILLLPADVDLLDPRAWNFPAWVVIAVLVVSGTALRFLQKKTGGGADTAASDERDALIRLRATRNAHVVLSAAIILVLVQVGLQDRAQRLGAIQSEPGNVLQLLATGPLQTMHVAYLMLAALWLASLTLNASRVFFYRRGGG